MATLSPVQPLPAVGSYLTDGRRLWEVVGHEGKSYALLSDARNPVDASSPAMRCSRAELTQLTIVTPKES